MRQVPRPKNHLDSFKYAVEGVIHAFRTQRHMRFHFLLVVLVLVLGLLCRFDAIKMVLLLFATSAVLVAEMFNTAVETVVDMITQSYHPMAKLAKDIAAGGVLITAVTAALVGFTLFFGGHTLGPIKPDVGSINDLPLVLAMLLVVLLVVVMATKVLGGKGSILRGGIISGHAALAFVLAVSIIRRAGMDRVSIILALMLALLVAQSRVEGKIHTVQEVIIGGLVGICLTIGIFYFRIAGH